MYYLQSRYYDPAVGRFVNADKYASTGQGFLGYNMIAYCNNNPINGSDPSGYAAGRPTTVAICDGGSGSVRDLGLSRAYSLGYNSDVTNEGISINMASNSAFINHLNSVYRISLEDICAQMTIGACTKYYELYGHEFLLSDDCVANEIYDHVIAYQWSIGERIVPNWIAIGFAVKKFSIDAVYQACKSIDIRLSDVVIGDIFSQSSIFNYSDGIRDSYKGTSRDPWANAR